MSYPSYGYNFSNSTLIEASQCNSNFSNLLSGIIDGTKDLNVNNFTAAGSMSVTGDAYTKGYSDYYTSSTITGWATASGYIRYKKIGKTVFVNYKITGTSNGATAKFTLPYNYYSSTMFDNLKVPAYTYLFPSSGVGMAALSSSNVLNIYYGPVSGSTFPASGSKFVEGSLVYESA
jgi:hypothetical protein